MTNQPEHSTTILRRSWGWTRFVLAVLGALTMVATRSAPAQTFSVLHNFTGGADGANTFSGLYVAPSGVLYGTATHGGTYGAGTVFKLNQLNSSWVFSPLYEFTGGSDGALPEGGVVMGPNGALYGTASNGGDNYGGVFELRPPPMFCRSVECYWEESVLHNFTGRPDGEYPIFVNLAFDQAGDIYGTTLDGGMDDLGTTFELTASGGGYTESILHSFGSGSDGQSPFSGVVLDRAGNVYGVTPSGGTGTTCSSGCGAVYQLMPSNGGWLENVLVNFDGANGYYPNGNLIIDNSGNLYGATLGKSGQGSVVYKLAPAGGGFTYSVLYTFISYCDSYGGVARDAAGHFFGVCNGGGTHNDGWIYELTNCSEACSLIDLHDFSGSDGASPYPGPVLDANGNLYGTTYLGGRGSCEDGCGVVWEITP